MSAYIYHLVLPEWWLQFADKNVYVSATLHEEKFIHTSTASQLEATANRYYNGHSELILLTIQTDLLDQPLIYEWAESVGQEFPHVYGGINKNAIVQIETIYPDDSGKFHIQK